MYFVLIFVSLLFVVLLVSGALALTSVMLLWNYRRMKLQRRKPMDIRKWIDEKYGSIENRFLAQIIFQKVANSIRVPINCLRPADRFEMELALTKNRLLDSFVDALDMNWTTTEEDINHSLDRASWFTSSKNASVVLDSSIESTIERAIEIMCPLSTKTLPQAKRW